MQNICHSSCSFCRAPTQTHPHTYAKWKCTCTLKSCRAHGNYCECVLLADGLQLRLANVNRLDCTVLCSDIQAGVGQTYKPSLLFTFNSRSSRIKTTTQKAIYIIFPPTLRQFWRDSDMKMTVYLIWNVPWQLQVRKEGVILWQWNSTV